MGPLKLAKLKPYSVLLLDNDITALSNEETCDNVRFLTFLVLGFLFIVRFEYEIVRLHGKIVRLDMSVFLQGKPSSVARILVRGRP